VKKDKIGLKGASGLGDSIYSYPIAKHYLKEYKEVYLMTSYPELFETLPSVKTYPHKKLNYIIKEDGMQQPIDIRFTYCGRKYTPGTSQFTDSVMSARINKKLDLSIPWTVKNRNLTEDIKAKSKGKKICILSAPYEPFGREDEFGAILRIKPTIMQDIVNEFRKDIYFVMVGNKFVLHKIKNVGMDLVDQTRVYDLFDLVKISDITLSQVGNMLPMSECLNKKNFIIYSKKAHESDNKFIAAITPEKVTHYKKLNTSIFDDDKKHLEKFNEFF
jgi:hypothetical protein